MAYKGFNTVIQEMKQKQIELINEYTQQGVPMAVIELNLESAMRVVENALSQQMLEEKEQYEAQLKEEHEDDLHS